MLGLCLAGIRGPASGQRAWGNAETLLLGPSAVVPVHSLPSPDPLNPAAALRIPTSAEMSLAVPLGLRELAIHRFAGRAAIGETSLSLMVGRSGFDRLTRHRVSVSVARSVSGSTGRPLLLGLRGRIDGFSSPDHATALEPALAAGGLFRWSDALETGLMTSIQDADVHGSRSIHILGALSLRFGRRLQAGLGFRQSTATTAEISTALVLETDWGGSLTAGISDGARNTGVACALRTGGVRIVMAWVRTGPAGATRYVAAGVFRTPSESEPSG